MRGRSYVCAVGLVLALRGPAHAEPPGQTPPAETITYKRRSENVATALTVAGIATPMALAYLAYEPDTDNPVWAPILFLGSIPMPALGHWYSNRIGGGGMLLRLGAFIPTVVGMDYLEDARRCARGEPVDDGCEPGDRTVGRIGVGLGLAAWVSSWVYDVFSARREARRFNTRHTFIVAPLATPHATGLAFGGSF